MPIFVLNAVFEMEAVDKFEVPSDTTWTFDIKQGAGDEEKKGVVIDPDEEDEVPNTKNTVANLVVKFPGDKSHSYLRVIKPGELKGLVTQPITGEDAQKSKMVPIAAFECRGLEPTRWYPTGPYTVTSISGTTYEDVDLRNEEWCEYDEKSGEAMTLSKEPTQQEFKLFRGK